MSGTVLNAGLKYQKWRFSLAVVLCALSGCLMTKGDGDDLRAALQQRMDERDKSSRAEIDKKLQELQALIDRATQVLERSSADVGNQVAEARDQLSAAVGQLSELSHRVDMLEQQMLAQRAD